MILRQRKIKMVLKKILVIIILLGIDLTASYDGKISEHDSRVDKCCIRCKQLSPVRKHYDAHKHDPKECYVNCIRKIKNMTLQKQEDLITKFSPLNC
jgi:hypothetical protein